VLNSISCETGLNDSENIFCLVEIKDLIQSGYGIFDVVLRFIVICVGLCV